MSTTAKSESQHSNSTDQVREAAAQAAQHATEMAGVAAKHYVQEPAQDIFEAMRVYAARKPEVAACWIFSLGFLIGWKLRS